MVPQEQVELDMREIHRQIAGPLNRRLSRFGGRRKHGPAEIKDVTTQDAAMTGGDHTPKLWLNLISIRAAGELVKVGSEADGLHEDKTGVWTRFGGIRSGLPLQVKGMRLQGLSLHGQLQNMQLSP